MATSDEVASTPAHTSSRRHLAFNAAITVAISASVVLLIAWAPSLFGQAPSVPVAAAIALFGIAIVAAGAADAIDPARSSRGPSQASLRVRAEQGGNETVLRLLDATEGADQAALHDVLGELLERASNPDEAARLAESIRQHRT